MHQAKRDYDRHPKFERIPLCKNIDRRILPEELIVESWEKEDGLLIMFHPRNEPGN
jgi:hypothetical protein